MPLAGSPNEEIVESDVSLPDAPEEVILEPEVPLADAPEAPEETEEILDEEVPMADVPKTGDESLIWAILALVSGMGLVGLAMDEKKRRTISK